MLYIAWFMLTFGGFLYPVTPMMKQRTSGSTMSTTNWLFPFIIYRTAAFEDPSSYNVESVWKHFIQSHDQDEPRYPGASI